MPLIFVLAANWVPCRWCFWLFLGCICCGDTNLLDLVICEQEAVECNSWIWRNRLVGCLARIHMEMDMFFLLWSQIFLAWCPSVSKCMAYFNYTVYMSLHLICTKDGGEIYTNKIVCIHELIVLIFLWYKWLEVLFYYTEVSADIFVMSFSCDMPIIQWSLCLYNVQGMMARCLSNLLRF